MLNSWTFTMSKLYIRPRGYPEGASKIAKTIIGHHRPPRNGQSTVQGPSIVNRVNFDSNI